MAGSYTYDPTKIGDHGKDRMRFELGDTVVDVGPAASPLCDEEYEAVLKAYPNWRRAKLKCLEAIAMKLSYEVNTSIDGLSYSLDGRADRWMNLYKDLKKELASAAAVPTGVPDAMYGKDEPHYFHTDMHSNHDKY